MKVLDLSHDITPVMPMYPGTPCPEITDAATLEANGYAEKRLVIYSHTGTHIDVPSHIFPPPQGVALDRMPIDAFAGSGAVIDLRGLEDKNIQIGHLELHKDVFQNHEFILFLTGWSHLWGQEEYFFNYPVLTNEAAQWMTRFKLKGIGVDAFSADAPDTIDLPVHKILLNHFIIIENLTDLEQLPTSGFTFTCFPLKIKNGEASPVRATALIID